MRTRAVTIACIVAAASVLLAWASMPAGPRGAPPPAPDTFAIAFDVPSVRSLTIDAAGLSASVTGDPAWRLTLPSAPPQAARSATGPAHRSATWPANPDAVRVLLNELATQAIEEADHGDAPPPLATITVDLGPTATAIQVLGPPLAGRIPLRITDATSSGPRTRDGFVAANRFRPTDAGQLAALATPRALDLPGVITRLSITPAGAPPVTVVRTAGVWSVPGTDPGPRIHQPTVRATIDDLRRVRAANVIVPLDPESLSGDAFLTIEATADLPRAAGAERESVTATLAIMAQTTVDGAYDALATREQPGATDRLQIRLDPQAFPVLPADINTLLDPAPLPWPAGDTARITFDPGQPDARGPVMLRRTLSGWTRNGEAMTRAQTDALGTLLDALTTTARAVRLAGTGQPAGPAIIFEPITAAQPIALTIGADGTATDRASLWTLDADPGPLNDAIRTLRKRTPSP